MFPHTFYTVRTYHLKSLILFGSYSLIHIGAGTQFTYIMDGLKWFFEDYWYRVRTAVDYLPRKMFNHFFYYFVWKRKFYRIRISKSFTMMNLSPEKCFLYIGKLLQVTAFTSTGSVDPTPTSGGSCARRGRQPQDRERDPADLPCPTYLMGRPSRGSSSRYCGLPKPDLKIFVTTGFRSGRSMDLVKS